MSNFYDLETDLEIEDVEEDEEDYEDISEFGQYDAEDAETRWGDLDFEELISELQRYLETSKKFFFSKKKRIINAEEVTHLLQYIEEKFPDEIRQSKDIIKNREEIIAKAKSDEERIVGKAQSYYDKTIEQAKDNAESIINRAKEEAEEMIASHSITQAARVRAEEIKDDCKREMNELIAKTNELCENHKREAREWAENITTAVYKFAAESLSSYQEVAKTNIEQINNVFVQFKSKYAEQMDSLKSNPGVQVDE